MNSIAAASISTDLLTGVSAFSRALAGAPRSFCIADFALVSTEQCLGVPSGIPTRLSPPQIADSLIRQMLSAAKLTTVSNSAALLPGKTADLPAAKEIISAQAQPVKVNCRILAATTSTRDLVDSIVRQMLGATPAAKGADPARSVATDDEGKSEVTRQAPPPMEADAKPAEDHSVPETLIPSIPLRIPRPTPPGSQDLDAKTEVHTSSATPVRALQKGEAKEAGEPMEPAHRRKEPAVTKYVLAVVQAVAEVPIPDAANSIFTATAVNTPCPGENRSSSPDPAGAGPVMVTQKAAASQPAELSFAARLIPLSDVDQNAPVPTPQPSRSPMPEPAVKVSMLAPATPLQTPSSKSSVREANPTAPVLSSQAERRESIPVRAIAAAAAVANTADFSRGPQGAAPPSRGSTETAAAFRTVAEAMLSSEPAAAASIPQSPVQPVQQIAVRVAIPELPPVDLRVSGHAGEIRVAVQTPDASLQSALRQDLGTLSSSLDRAGYRSEIFVPAPSVHPTISTQHSQSSSEHDPRGCGGWPNFPGRQGQQNRKNRSRKSWLDEMEKLK